MEFNISSKIRELCPKVVLGILEYDVLVKNSSLNLIREFEEEVAILSQEQTTLSVAQNPNIASTCKVCEMLTKSTERCHNTAEGILMQIVSGKGLPHINNVTDINNLIMASSGYSIGLYDMDKLAGPVELCWADEECGCYDLKGNCKNIGCLPILCDRKGFFGSPIGDDCRTLIQPGFHKIMNVIYSFDGRKDMDVWMQKTICLLKNFCDVTEVKTQFVDIC